MLNKIKYHFHPITKLEKQRQELNIPDACSPELKTLLNTPLPSVNAVLRDLNFLVMDFETTGIDPKNDSLLSIGSVSIINNQIDMQTSAHCYVDNDQKIKAASAVVNHITPQMLLEGDHLDEAMNRLFAKMTNKVVIVHGAVIERRFIETYLMRRYGLEHFPIIFLDTLKIEKELKFHNKEESDGFQLNQVRRTYGLPIYSAHNALADALATAELYMVQLIKIFGKKHKDTQIGQVCCRATV